MSKFKIITKISHLAKLTEAEAIAMDQLACFHYMQDDVVIARNAIDQVSNSLTFPGDATLHDDSIIKWKKQFNIKCVH